MAGYTSGECELPPANPRLKLTLNRACANIQTTRRPLFYAQKRQFHTLAHTAGRQPYPGYFRACPLIMKPDGTAGFRTMRTNQE